MKVETLVPGGFFANCYLVWDEASSQAAVIDPGGHVQRIARALTDRRLTCAAILLTHGHYDHVMGAPALQRLTGAPVYLHRDDMTCFSDPRVTLLPGYPPRFSPPATMVAMEDGFALSLGGLTFCCRHTPGHSAGSAILCVTQRSEHQPDGRGVWFSGDTLFRFEIGRLDLFGGSPADMRKTLQKILETDGDADIYPGHGPVTTLAEEKAGNPYLLGAAF